MITPTNPRTLATTIGIAIGAVVWLGRIAAVGADPSAIAWAVTLLLLAPLVIVPMALPLLRYEPGQDRSSTLLRLASRTQLPAALMLVGAFALNKGSSAALLCFPWLLVTLLIAAAGATTLWQRIRSLPHYDACMAGAMLFLPIGAGWLLLSRFGARPLGFNDVIVLLTAIHFHYAGFALLMLTARCSREDGTRSSRIACFGVLAGVPLVAAGITATQLGLHPIFECLAACWLSIAGFLAGVQQFRLALRSSTTTTARWLWIVSAVSLMFAMTLSFLYGIRAFFPIPALDIPFMRAFHGTANAIGYALLGLLARIPWPVPRIRLMRV